MGIVDSAIGKVLDTVCGIENKNPSSPISNPQAVESEEEEEVKEDIPLNDSRKYRRMLEEQERNGSSPNRAGPSL